MDILKNLNSIDTESIKKLKEVTHLDKCKVCNDTINTDTDESVTYSSDFECLDFIETVLMKFKLCVVCKRPAIHLEQDICSKCMNNHSVRNYSYKPDSRFHRINPKKNEPLTSFSGESKHGMPILHFGVEIEVDVHADQDDYDNNIVFRWQ